MNLAVGDLENKSKFQTPVGVLVRIRDATGKPLDYLTAMPCISSLLVETDLNGALTTRERPYGLPAVGGSPTRSPVRSSVRLTGGETFTHTHNKDMMLPILRRKFPTMYHAFAFFDLDNGNVVGPREVKNFIQRLRNDGEALEQFQEDDFLLELGMRHNASTLDFHTFVQFFKFGDTLENWKEKLEAARLWRNKVLADQRASQAFVRESLTLCEQVKKSLKDKFKDVAEAFVFFDTQATTVISESGMKMGLKRIGLEHINVKALLKEVDENCVDGIIDEHEFRRYFAWHSTHGYDEMIFRALANRREIASRNFRSSSNSLLRGSSSRRNSSTSLLRASAGSSRRFSLSVARTRSQSSMSAQDSFARHGSAPNVLNARRRSSTFLSSWDNTPRSAATSPGGAVAVDKLNQLRKLLVAELKCHSDELLIAGVQDGDVVFAVLPDPRGVRPPQHLAERLKKMLMEPKNPLTQWDSNVRGAQQTVVLGQGAWDYNSVCKSALLDETMSTGLLTPGAKAHKPLNPTLRSMAFLKTLGAQDHWVALDGTGRVGSKEVLDMAQFTVLWHSTLDIMIELRHLSYASFNFAIGADLNIHSCTEEGRERPAKEADFHAIDTAYRIRNGEGITLSERFAQFDSPAVGRWVVYMGVPRVEIRNVCDEEFCLLLLPAGFLVLGAGRKPAALRVEGCGEPEAMSIAEAKRFVRHQPTQEDDSTAIDGRHEAVVKERKEKLQKMEEAGDGGEDPKETRELLRRVENTEMWAQLLVFFETAAKQQAANEQMLLREGFRACCSAGKKLMDMVPVGTLLPVGERMNRRAHIVRLCGDFGKAWVSGTGCSTELAFFLDTVRSMVSAGKLNVALASFFRVGHEDPVHVVAFLAKQLKGFLGKEQEDSEVLSRDDLKDLCDASYKSLARILHRILRELVEMDKAVLLVLDNLSLAEQRVLGHTMSMLRTDLQPWTYSLKRLGFVRIVFSGCDGYSAPSGVPMATIQLRRLTPKRAERLLGLLLRRMKKHIHSQRLHVLLAKEGAGYVQYIRIAAEVVRDFWVFEQNNGYVEGLPATLEGMYGTMLKALEHRHGAETVEKVLAFLTEHGVMTAKELRQLQGEEPGREGGFPKEESARASTEGTGDAPSDLDGSLRWLLRIPEGVERFEVSDPLLRAAILARYDGTQEATRANEAEAREREDARRTRELLECPVYVVEAHSSIRTACSSLQEAVDSAAAGDVVVVRQDVTTLQRGLRVWRPLTIRAEGWSAGQSGAPGSESVDAEGQDKASPREDEDEGPKQKLLQIGFGQSILEICNGAEERLGGGPAEDETIVVTLQGLGLKQVGFEAADIPVTIHVSDGGKVAMSGCTVSSEEGVGIRVQGGTLVMEDSACVSCATQGVMVESGGVAELSRCRLIANPATELKEEEQALHDLFLRFCKGAVAQTGAETSKRIGGELKLSSMGSRATTLDLFEFTEVLTELGIYPAELTKTQVAEFFARSNASGLSDEVASEMDWLEFKDGMLDILQALGRGEVMGLTTDMLVASKNAKDAFSSSWKYSDGITVMGSGSRADLRDCEVVNAIHGCHVLARGAARLENCTMASCGRDRSDAASVTSSGQGAVVELKACTLDRSGNYGLSLSKGGRIQAEGCKVVNTGKQGVIAMGRGTRVDLRGTEVMGSGRSGVRAGQTALVNLASCTIANSAEAGIVSGFLGTRVNVDSCCVRENALGIVAENEGLVVVGGSLDGIEDTCVCQRKGRLEKRRAELSQDAEADASAGPQVNQEESAEGTGREQQGETKESSAEEDAEVEDDPEDAEGDEVLVRFRQHCKGFKTGREAFDYFSMGTGAVSRDNVVDGLLTLRADQEGEGADDDYDASWAEDDATELWYLLEIEEDDVIEEQTFIARLGRKRWQPKQARAAAKAEATRQHPSREGNVKGLLGGQVKGRCAKPETRKVMKAMMGWFDNVAEAFVMLDANAGGQVSLAEMERGLKRLGVFAGLDFAELGREVGMQDGEELDIFRFVNFFIWHPHESFPEGSWQEGYMEARRSRRRIVERFNQRFSDGGAHPKKEAPAGPSVLERDLMKRLQRKKLMSRRVRELERTGDNSAKKQPGRYLVHGGHVYKDSRSFLHGVSITKFPTTHGLPGTPTKYIKGATPARYLSALDGSPDK